MAASELKQAEARPSRFSSPSRPRKTDLTEAMDAVRSLGTGTAAFALLQSLAWMVMSLVGGLVYRDVIPSPDPPRWRWSRFDDLITNLYFKANPMFPELPEDGLATPLTVYRFMGLTLIVNFVWFITSSVMFRQVRLGGRRSAKVSVIVWSLSTALVTVLDVVVGTIFGRDTVLLASDWPAADDFYGDPGTVIAIAAGLMLVALRFVVLLVANVVCMGVLLRRASRLRPDRPDVAADLSPPPSATAREGPIDAFLYRNEDRERMGIQNPVFVPDSPVVPARQPWQSFRPEQAAELGRREELAERRARAPANKSDPDDMSYLSWMEDVDKHVEMRSRPRPSAPPSVSSSAPSYRQSVADQPGRRPPPQRQVQTFQGAPVHHRPAGDTAFRPASQEARLPRLRLNPDAPKFPFIPPPDYSPQAQRRPTSRLGRTDR